jgi:hypothetical protein
MAIITVKGASLIAHFAETNRASPFDLLLWGKINKGGYLNGGRK